jgi:hypothetical protein
MALTVPTPSFSVVPEPGTEEEALDSMRVLLETGHAKEAQQAAARWAKQFPDSAKLAKWDDVLNYQHSEYRPSTWRDHGADDVWIKQNAYRYPGNWMALRGGGVVAMDPSLETVRKRVEELGIPAEEILLWCQPREITR